DCPLVGPPPNRSLPQSSPHRYAVGMTDAGQRCGMPLTWAWENRIDVRFPGFAQRDKLPSVGMTGASQP
ncbi:MAG TPA: hypothetical protein VIT91_18980, partial [Chthoniobacterales bacterium]